MKAGGWIGVFGFGFVVAAATESLGASISLVPVKASGTYAIVGNEIRLTGGGQRVWLEVKLAGWGPGLLKSWQAKIDSTRYSSGLAGTLTPASLACTATSQCATAFEVGSRCSYPPGVGGFCGPGFINGGRTDWVHVDEEIFGVTKDVGVSNFDFIYFAVVTPPGVTADPGSPRYGGTLVLDVPTGAAGTFDLRFIENSDDTFMADDNNVRIPNTTLGRAKITVLCQNAAECNDGNNCTTDGCLADGTCSNLPNHDASQFCCNPSNGALTQLSDNKECTSDVCNAATGQVTHPNLPALTACGDPTNAQCNKPDSCDGGGLCLARLEPTTTACGDLTNTTCNPADTCDGAGGCVARIATAGTACGSPVQTGCDNSDTCNGLGACLTNLVPNGTPCDDGQFCTTPADERCLGGSCVGGSPRNCADSLTCTTDVCNESTDKCDHLLDPNRCLIGDVCYGEGAINIANTCEQCQSASNATSWTVLPDAAACNDGNACTGTGRPGIGVDTCTAGTCAGVADPECNDQCDFAVPAVVGINLSNNGSTGPDDAEASCQPDSNADVWFEYTAQCDGAVFISTTGSSLSPVNDSVLSVWSNCPGSGGVEIVCDDDSGVGLSAALTFGTTLGTTYLIRVAGFEDNVGPIVMNLAPVDDCLIDGVCYAKGDLNPENDCEACIPEITSVDWSPRSEGSSCGNVVDTDCDSPDACDGFGVCELNYKTDGTSCSDDGNQCSKDYCETGACIHPPEPAGLACGSSGDTECDNPDTCDGGGSCAVNFETSGFPCGDQSESQCDNPDICNGTGSCLENLKADGTPCNDADLCTGSDECTSGTCAGTSILQAPTVQAISGRHLQVTPNPPGSPAPIALRVTSPNWPCLLNYVAVNGRLVNPPDRVYRLNDDWGTILVVDPDIVPSSIYEVRAECGAFVSAPGSARTYTWGDVDGDTDVDIIDVSYLVNKMKDLFVPFSVAAMDFAPCDPDGKINVMDLAEDVDALKGLGYPCSFPCHD